MSTPNLWERAKEALEAALAYDAAIQRYAVHGKSWVEGDDLDALYAAWLDKSRAVLADMERAECVEGASQTGLVLGYDTFVASPPRADERPALLILEKP